MNRRDFIRNISMSVALSPTGAFGLRLPHDAVVFRQAVFPSSGHDVLDALLFGPHGRDIVPRYVAFAETIGRAEP